MRRARRAGAILVIASLLAAGLAAVAAAHATFAAWLAAVRQDARSRGVSEATLEAALTELEPLPRVIELDRRQLEFTLTLEQYLARVVPEGRVTEGRQQLAEHQARLARVADRYGVEPRVLVALWGIETRFGQDVGSYPVIGVLATLAWEGRRRAFFRGELLDALTILDELGVPPGTLVGSWAGAMGQPQFMPSTFRRFAVDFDGDGRADIWQSLDDVFASAANYLARAGWQRGQPWGQEGWVPPAVERGPIGLRHPKRLREWTALGVRGADGALSADAEQPAWIVQPDGPRTRAFVVFENYRALLRWNRSELFGIAVGTLADQIGGP